MITLKTPGDAVGIIQIRWRSIGIEPGSIRDCNSVAVEGRYPRILKLVEDADIQRYLVKEKANTTTHYGTLCWRGQERKTESWCEVVLVADSISVVSQTQIECQAMHRCTL